MFCGGIIMDNTDLMISMQELGANIVVGEMEKAWLVHAQDNFAIIRALINEVPVLIFTKTVMYPANYNAAFESSEDTIKEVIQMLNVNGDFDKFDIYGMGVGAVQKYVDIEEEKGEFRIGGIYAAGFGYMKLIKKASALEIGYTLDRPLPTGNVSNEYYLLENIVADNGLISKTRRICSMHSSNGNIVDKWSISVMGYDGTFEYKYELYLDPYSGSMFDMDLQVPAGFKKLLTDDEEI